MTRRRLLGLFDAVFPPSVALFLATVGALLSTFVAATTLVPAGPLLPTVAAALLFAGMFPVGWRSVRTAQIEGGDFKELLLRRPHALLVVLAVFGACAVALEGHAIVTDPGGPERHGDAYYLRDHTKLTRTSRAQYRYAERVSQRELSTAALIFYLIGIVIHVPPARPARFGASATRSPSSEPANQTGT